MEHPFELEIADLQTINFELVDLDDIAATQVVGGTATLSRSAENGGNMVVTMAYPESGGFPVGIYHRPRHPRQNRPVLYIQPDIATTGTTTGRFASQAAMDAYINSPDFDPEMLKLI
jgi:outer membrane receptor protein involved in Fe transport